MLDKNVLVKAKLTSGNLEVYVPKYTSKMTTTVKIANIKSILMFLSGKKNIEKSPDRNQNLVCGRFSLFVVTFQQKSESVD